MKACIAVAVVALMVLTIGSASVRAQVADPGAPKYANSMLEDFSTPTVAPGKTVDFAFNLTNPYKTPAATMTDIALTVGVYEYATQESSREINSSFKNPPLIDGGAPEKTLTIQDLSSGQSVRVSLAIDTTGKTPHGSYFSQSTYFVRFRLTFNLDGNASTTVVLQSRGFFTDAQWSRMVSFEADQAIVDTDYMKSLGVSGIIPDSSFGIKVPIPRWPLAVLVAACIGVTMLAAYYFVLENPGKYPRLEKRAYYLRGKLGEFRGHLKHRP